MGFVLLNHSQGEFTRAIRSRRICFRRRASAAGGGGRKGAKPAGHAPGGGSEQALFLHRAGGEGGVLVVAGDQDFPGFFLRVAVGFGDGEEGAGNVVIPPQMLHQVLGHGGQAVGVLNVLIVIVGVAEGGALPVADQRDAGGVQTDLVNGALLEARKAGLGGQLGGPLPHGQRNRLGVQRFVAALADFQQNIPHHAAFQQRPDFFFDAGLTGLGLELAQNPQVSPSIFVLCPL